VTSARAPVARAQGSRTGGRLLRSILLGLLIGGVVAVSLVDADGDPMTTNVPSVVLAAEADIPTEGEVSHVASEPTASAFYSRLVRSRRTVDLWLGMGQSRWLPRVHPIRGP
jgi:hypothetical protein